MFTFLTKSRLIRADVRPFRAFFLIFELFLAGMIFTFHEGWQNLALFVNHQPVVTTELFDVAFVGFIGFYGLRLAIFIAFVRRFRMPQIAEWIVTIVPASIALVCIVLGSPIERIYAASLGYTNCGSVRDREARSSFYVFALDATGCANARAHASFSFVPSPTEH